MSLRVVIAALSLLLVSTSCATPLQREQKAAAVPFAQRWLGYLESGEQEIAWREVSTMAKLRYEKDVQLKQWFGTRQPLGQLIERRLELSWSLNPIFMPSVADGTYWEIRFRSEFEHRKHVIERLRLVWEDGQWRLLDFGLI